jgi:anti-sigma-K factor RskA
VTGLPPTSGSNAYELWGIAGAEPVPAGVFTVNQGGVTLFRLPALPPEKSFDKFAVTLEPAGGVPQPTGPMHLVGSV